jgi:site-specific DNA-cytosine methylase
MAITAIDFFSGIGAFSYAARRQGIEVIAAFDQDERARQVYALNFAMAPSTRNLDSITAAEIPPADIWWLSPPCQPYSIRGARKDESDTRSQSLKRLISLMKEKLPRLIILENVYGFSGSQMQRLHFRSATDLGYRLVEFRLCSTDLKVPMKRPRLFMIATLSQAEIDSKTSGLDLASHMVSRGHGTLGRFVDREFDDQLLFDRHQLSKYIDSLNIVDAKDDSAVCICFTSGYGVSLKASGSLLTTDRGVRYFSPGEILRLLGFGDDFKLPENLTLKECWQLLGNSVDVRQAQAILQNALANLQNVQAQL